MSNIITPAKNYAFIVDSFNDRKKGVKGVTLEGASRTSKTWDTCIFICQYMQRFKGKTIVIGRDNFANLKVTTYKTLKQVWSLFGYPAKHFNKVASNILFNGNEIIFAGVNDDIFKAHGLESDLLFLNEVISIPRDTVDQLEQRNREFFIYDFNPNALTHWVFDYELREDVRSFKTTIFDNPYIPKNSFAKIVSYAHPEIDDSDLIESILAFRHHTEGKQINSLKHWEEIKNRNLEKKTSDKTKWLIYGKGQRAVSDNVIFNSLNYFRELPPNLDFTERLICIDFGYTSDPTIILDYYEYYDNVYLVPLVYRTGMLNNNIAEYLKSQDLQDELVIVDNAPVQNANELRQLGINANPAQKFPGSKVWGISSLKQCNIYLQVGDKLENQKLKEEFSFYHWQKLRDGSFKRNSLGQRVPIDGNDHFIDGALYGKTYFLEPPKKANNEEDS